MPVVILSGASCVRLPKPIGRSAEHVRIPWYNIFVDYSGLELHNTSASSLHVMLRGEEMERKLPGYLLLYGTVPFFQSYNYTNASQQSSVQKSPFGVDTSKS